MTNRHGCGTALRARPGRVADAARPDVQALRRAARGGRFLPLPGRACSTSAAAPAAQPWPGAPGQFAFADRLRVGTILKESGWTDIDIRPIDLSCALPEKVLVSYLSRLGPIGLVLREADERTRVQVIERVRAAFNPYVYGDEARFTAACWMVCARAPAAPEEVANA